MLPPYNRRMRSGQGNRVLAVVVVAIFFGILFLSFGRPGARGFLGQGAEEVTSEDRAVPRPKRSELGEMDELIMVAGHAVMTAVDQAKVDSEESWFLEKLQHGQLSTYIRHIEKGVELAAENPRSVLMYSGGQTRGVAGPRSEGLSYWLASQAKGWWGRPEVKERTLIEEYARDSFENLMFSMCRFKEVYGNYPTRLTVVSYSYKRQRFVDLHREAIQFPLARFKYVGVDPDVNPYNDQRNIDKFSEDPYGCQQKSIDLRTSRNPFHRTVPYLLVCTALLPPHTLPRAPAELPSDAPPAEGVWEDAAAPEGRSMGSALRRTGIGHGLWLRG